MEIFSLLRPIIVVCIYTPQPLVVYLDSDWRETGFTHSRVVRLISRGYVASGIR